MSRNNRGFTLIEVMVAVLILAVGLLGMASLMTRSQKSNESAYARSQATALTYDIIERVRSNVVAVPNKTYLQMFVLQSVSNASKYAIGSLPACTAPGTAIPKGGADRAQYDLNKWCASLRDSLPSVDSANTKISFDTTHLIDKGIVSMTVSIQWQEKTSDGSAVQKVDVVTVL